MKKRSDLAWRILVALLLVFALAPVVMLTGPVQAAPAPPDTTIVAIADYINSLTSITGTATDDVGVAGVDVTIKRTLGTTAEYWNGSSWQSTSTFIVATASDGAWGEASEDWKIDTAKLPSLTDGTAYIIAATAVDNVGEYDHSPATESFIYDVTKPTLTSIVWADVDNSSTINSGDKLIFIFSDAMDTTTLDSVAEINSRLDSTASGTSDYGTTFTVSWNAGRTLLTVTLGTGEAISGGETVNPTADVKDKAGNADNTTSPGPRIPATPPETTISAVADYVNSLNSVTGTVTAGAGVDRVNVTIKRTIETTIEYWNGSSWQSTSISTAATPSDGAWDEAGEDWKMDTTTSPHLPSWTDGAAYIIAATAVDDADNPDPTPATESFIYDVTGPTLAIITWTDVDNSGTINSGDKLIFIFSDAMDTTTLDSVSEINWGLDSTASGTSDYGTTFTVSWNTARNLLTATLGTDEAIGGGETVNPASTVTDQAGNADATTAPGAAIPMPPALGLQWWHILLIALGGLVVVIGLGVLVLRRRRRPPAPEEVQKEEI